MGIRTDLAVESHNIARGQSGADIPGIAIEELGGGEGITITRVRVMDERGEQAIGRTCGQYITLDSPALADEDAQLHERMSDVLYQELKTLMGDAKPPFLVVGLGNRNVTADALGSEVIDHIIVTRHLKEYLPEQFKKSLNSVAAVAPGVLGVTGIETGEVIRSLVDKIKPGLIIVIDALAAQKASRIGTTIQLCDSGIEPGSGIGGNRMPLSRETLGVPVVALGVPMVVHAGNIVADAVEGVLANEDFDSKQGNTLMEHIKALMTARIGDLVVTPKEIDALVKDLSRILSLSINRALHAGLHPNEVFKFFMA